MIHDCIIVFAAQEAVVFNRAGDRVKSYPMTDFSNIKTVAAKVEKDIPAHSIAATYLLQIDADYDTIVAVANALDEAGFKDFETINSTSFTLTQVLLSMPDLECRQGQLLHVIVDPLNNGYFVVDSYVLRKTAEGFDIIDFTDGQNADIKEELKNLDSVLIAYGKDKVPEESYKKLFPNKKRMYTKLNTTSMSDYVWNMYDGGNLNGMLVSDAAGMEFGLTGFTGTEHIDMKSMAVPGTRVIERWFRESTYIEVDVTYQIKGADCTAKKLDLVYQADYKARITIDVKENRIPCVEIEVIKTANKRKQTSVLMVAGFRVDAALPNVHLDNRPIAVYISCFLLPAWYYAIYKDSEIVPVAYSGFDSMEKLAKDINVKLPLDKIEILVDTYITDMTMESRLHRAKALATLGVNVFPISYLSLNWTRVFMENKFFVPIGQSVACWDFYNCIILVKQSDGFRIIYRTDEANLDILDTYEVQTVVITRHFNRSRQMVAAAIEALHPRTVHFFDFSDVLTANYKSSIWKCADDDHDCYFVHDFSNFTFTVKGAKETKVFETGYVSLPHEFSVELDVGEAKKVEVSYDLNSGPFKSKGVTVTWDLQKWTCPRACLVVNIENGYDVDITLHRSSTQNQPCTRVVLFHKVSNGFEKHTFLKIGSSLKPSRFATLKLGLQSLPHPELTTLVLNVKDLSIEERQTYSKLLQSYNFLHVKFDHDPYFSFALRSLVNVPQVRSCPVGEHVLLIGGESKAKKAKKGNKEPIFDVFVFKRCENSFRLVCYGEYAINALRSDFRYVRRAVVFGESEKRVSKWLKVCPDLLEPYLKYNFNVEWEGGSKWLDMKYQVIPFSYTLAVRVKKCNRLTINMTDGKKTHSVSELKFDSLADGIVVFTLAVDEFLVPSATLVRTIQRMPSIILEMTADNRVVIHSKNYKGRTEFPAYVSFKEKINVKDKINVGDSALAQLKSDPAFIVYDVTKLLNINFDLLPSNPKWKFATSRSDDGDLQVQLGDITCSVHMLFAYIVQATFLAVKEQVKSEFKTIGVQLPDGCAVSEDWRQKISGTMGVDLVVFT